MGGEWLQTKFNVSPGPGLLPFVLGPFGPDLGPDLDLTWDLDLDVSLTIASRFKLESKGYQFKMLVLHLILSSCMLVETTFAVE